MRKVQLRVPLIVTEFSWHSDLKNMILDLISQENGNPVSSVYEKVSRSDYTCNPMTVKPYYKMLMPYLMQDVYPVLKELDIEKKDFQVVNYWFQQYFKTDFYDWHRHSHCSWIMIYYLELPKDGPKTQAIDMWDNKTVITADIKEGDILIMPGMIKHCSPVNSNNDRKTVIAFNTVVY